MESSRLFGGRLCIVQPREGYRFSLEALLLSGFVHLRGRERVLDLGAGCGVIAAVLALRYPGTKIVALEIQEILCQALRRTVRENALEGRVFPLRGDLRRLPLKGGVFEVVVSNPPFKPPQSGRLPPEESHLLARTEARASLGDFLRAARQALKTGGRLFLVHTSLRLAEVLSEMRQKDLSPRRIRPVYPAPGKEARFFLAEAVAGGRTEARLEPPLFIHEVPGGEYSEELRHFFARPEEGLVPRP
ncbi:methyltransferase [Thermosulfurimonas marina]|uniref:Methyltransferase n=1 Tax=Thermosulfurimonas marina TaxID=2047767 RepID=A0A6H1WU33_9BACT|nr:methyltransferase [Thermosulfurimonas marina]QJA06698.1 methyltransferase [Thermosulfurimonas marina]